MSADGPDVLDELRLAANVLMVGDAEPTIEQRGHALKHTRTAALLLASPRAKILGRCGRAACYGRAPKIIGGHQAQRAASVTNK